MSLVIAFPLEVEHSWSLLCHLVVTRQHKFSHEVNLVWFLFRFMPMGYLEYMLSVITIIKMQPFNSKVVYTEGKWHSSKYEFLVLYFSLCYLNLDYIFIKRKIGIHTGYCSGSTNTAMEVWIVSIETPVNDSSIYLFQEK